MSPMLPPTYAIAVDVDEQHRDHLRGISVGSPMTFDLERDPQTGETILRLRTPEDLPVGALPSNHWLYEALARKGQYCSAWVDSLDEERNLVRLEVSLSADQPTIQ